MARLIAVSIDCRNEGARQTFEEIVSRRRDYLVTKGQGTGTADILLLELDELRPQQTFNHICTLLKTSPELEVFLTASRTDPQVLLDAFRHGVKEFLPQPLTRQEVEPALARFEERLKGKTAGAAVEAGRVICVFGARGGVGTSTVATNVAISVKLARQRESVAIADLDMHGGDLGLLLDLRATQGLKHLSEDVSRLDDTIIKSTMVTHASGVHFLASGYEGCDEAEPKPGSAMRVIGLLRSLYQHVVVDCGHVLDPVVREAVDCADRVVLVTTLSLPAIRRAKRWLEALRASRYPTSKVVVVINRYSNDHKALLDETERMLDLKVSGLIPNDYATANEAVNHGQPLSILAPRTVLGQWYVKETGRLIDDKSAVDGEGCRRGQDSKGSLLGRCFASLGFEPKGKPSAV